MSENELCEFLDWDSKFFERRIARVKINQLDAGSIARINDWCASEKIDCLYFLADFDDPETIRQAEANDFNLIDIRLTFEQKPQPQIANPADEHNIIIRSATTADIPALREIAKVSHTDSRFYYDANFAKEKCDELYALWIENSLGGFADFVLVADWQNEVLGYLTGSISRDKIGNIGLVSVRADAQGKGVGKKLVAASLTEFAACGAARVEVVTQGRNTRAQRLYQKNGFVTKSLNLWYHRWSKDAALAQIVSPPR